MSGRGSLQKTTSRIDDREEQLRQVRVAIAGCGISEWYPTSEREEFLFPRGNERIIGRGLVNGREVRHAVEWYPDDRVLCLSTAFLAYQKPVSIFRFSWQSIFCIGMSKSFYSGLAGTDATNDRAYVCLYPEGSTFISWFAAKVPPSVSIRDGIWEAFRSQVLPFLRGVDYCALFFACYDEFPSDDGVEFIFTPSLGNS